MKRKFKIAGLIVAISLFSCGCGIYEEHNRKPDDDLSRAVRDAVGEDFYYQGKEERDSGEVWYEYLIQKKEANAITEFVNAINDFMSAEQGKITVMVFTVIPGGFEQVFYLQNYSDSELEKPDYGGLYLLCIRDISITRDQFFYDPSIYTGIEGIRELDIGFKMQQKAEEEGIDWYTYWPDLEEVIVREEGVK